MTIPGPVQTFNAESSLQIPFSSPQSAGDEDIGIGSLRMNARYVLDDIASSNSQHVESYFSILDTTRIYAGICILFTDICSARLQA